MFKVIILEACTWIAQTVYSFPYTVLSIGTSARDLDPYKKISMNERMNEINIEPRKQSQMVVRICRKQRFKSRFCVAFLSSFSSSMFSWLLSGPMASALFALCVNESHNEQIFLCTSFASTILLFSTLSLSLIKMIQSHRLRYVWHYVLSCTGNCCFGW